MAKLIFHQEKKKRIFTAVNLFRKTVNLLRKRVNLLSEGRRDFMVVKVNLFRVDRHKNVAALQCCSCFL